MSEPEDKKIAEIAETSPEKLNLDEETELVEKFWELEIH